MTSRGQAAAITETVAAAFGRHESPALPVADLVEFMRAYRLRAGISYRALGDRVHRTAPAIAELERFAISGKNVTVERLSQYLEALGFEVLAFKIRDPRGAIVLVGPGAAARPLWVSQPGTPVPGREDMVVGTCHHLVDRAEWERGLRMCQDCDEPQEAGQDGQIAQR